MRPCFSARGSASSVVMFITVVALIVFIASQRAKQLQPEGPSLTTSTEEYIKTQNRARPEKKNKHTQDTLGKEDRQALENLLKSINK